MGTETKFNCYKENTTATTGSVLRPKVAHNGSSSIARANVGAGRGIIGISGVDQKLHSSNGALNGAFNYKQQQQRSDIKNGSTTSTSNCGKIETISTPVFVPIHIGEDVISGAKDILKVIRPHWNISHIQFKKFTDGITNKLVGCFYNPPQSTATSNSNDNDIETGNSNGNETPSSPSALASSTLLEDNNDSGNISDTDTLDSEVTTSSTTEIVSHNTSVNLHIKDDSYNDSTASHESNVALVRVYGNKTDLLIDRKAETRNIQLLHMYGFAPTLFATFKNGLVYDFVPGVTLKPTSVLEPNIWRLVATRMAEMHRRVKMLEMPGATTAATAATATGGGGAAIGGEPPVPMLWSKMQSFFDLVPECFSDPDKHKRPPQPKECLACYDGLRWGRQRGDPN